MRTEQPKRIRHSYTQSLGAPPDEVFPLLCPVRESDWVPEWDPVLVLTGSGVVEQDCVFVTSGDPNDAIWVVTRHDPQAFEVEMIKVTPGHTVGKLEITVTQDQKGGSRAEIAYQYTALGPAGEAFLATFTPEWYESFMKDWQNAMNHYLSTGERIV